MPLTFNGAALSAGWALATVDPAAREAEKVALVQAPPGALVMALGTQVSAQLAFAVFQDSSDLLLSFRYSSQ